MKYKIIVDIIAGRNDNSIVKEVVEAMASFSGLDGLKRAVHTRHSSGIALKDIHSVNYKELIELYKEETSKKGFEVQFIYLIAIEELETKTLYKIGKYYLNPEFKYMTDGVKYMPAEKALEQLGYSIKKDSNNSITKIDYDYKNNK